MIFIWFLATQQSYREISILFNVPESTCCELVHKMAETFTKYLVPKCIKWPTEEEGNAIAAAVEARTGFSGVIGMIDGCHIPVKRPAHTGEEYTNRLEFSSVVLQGLTKRYIKNLKYLACIK